MAYHGYITTLKEVRKHENADRLKVAKVFGNSVVIGLEMKEGEKVLYFPTDGQLNYDFALENNLLRKDKDGVAQKGYMDPFKRNVSSIKLRGEKSDGLIMNLETLSPYCDITTLKEGDTIDTLGGVMICEKYIPRGKEKKGHPQNMNKVKEKEKVQFPFFEQHRDTSQLAYNTGQFSEGDLCYITLKLHGTSQRTGYMLRKEELPPTFMDKVTEFFGNKPKKRTQKSWELVTGTRRVTLKNFDGGYYGGNEFRKQWHDFFEGKLQKGETVYLEVVGFTDAGQLIMPECNNKKTKDKEFIKKYGETTRFTYGCEEGQSDIYVYRMTMTNSEGYCIDYSTEMTKLRCEQMGVKHAPVLEKFFFTTVEDLIERVNRHEDGLDPIGKNHIREGVCVRIENKEKFTTFKQKNWDFKCLEGIIKSEDILDMEEEASIEVEE